MPPALAAWATGASTLGASSELVGGLVAVCLLVAVALLLVTRRHRARDDGRRDDSGGGSRSTESVVGGRKVWPRVTVAASLLCVAAAAASAGLHGADLRRGPVPALAREYATVTAEVEITSDPRLARPRVRGDHLTPGSVLIEAEVRSVEGPARTAVATRAPVLVVVDVGSGWGTSGSRTGFAGRAGFRGTTGFSGTAGFPGTAGFSGTTGFPGTARFAGRTGAEGANVGV
ncbi:hypothetical protein KMT30_45395, partial [Streptomyces sp. IBSBF 2953]|nr:hypothetical protein [Streptomyces hayashii]